MCVQIKTFCTTTRHNTDTSYILHTDVNFEMNHSVLDLCLLT